MRNHTYFRRFTYSIHSKELQNMLHSRRKAEIEILSSHSPIVPSPEDALTSYLVEKIIAAQDVCHLDKE